MRLLNAADGPDRDSLSQILTRSYDIVVVGAGLTGLQLARRLTRAGLHVLVVEASDRVGGRVRSARMCRGVSADMGAEFIGPTQNNVCALINDLGLHLDPVTTVGENVFESSAGRSTFPASDPIPPVDADSLNQLMSIAVELDALSSAPWSGSAVADPSVADWVRRRAVTPTCRELVDFVCRSMTSAEPEVVSMRHLVGQIRAAGDADNPGSIFRIITTGDGAQMYRIAEGCGPFIRGLLDTLGCPVVGEAPVLAIGRSPGGFAISTETAQITANSVVFAMSPVLAGRIDYRFSLDPLISARHSAYLMGKSIKFAAAYREDFWSSEGLSGHLMSTCGPVQSVYSRRVDDSVAILSGFVKADDATELIRYGVSGIRGAITEHLSRVFGDQSRTPDAFQIAVWDDASWSGGCPCAFEPAGQFDPLAGATSGDTSPVSQDGVYWCGTETASYWRGYMDGALGAADRMSDFITHTLRSG